MTQSQIWITGEIKYSITIKFSCMEPKTKIIVSHPFFLIYYIFISWIWCSSYLGDGKNSGLKFLAFLSFYYFLEIVRFIKTWISYWYILQFFWKMDKVYYVSVTEVLMFYLMYILRCCEIIQTYVCKCQNNLSKRY